MKLDMLEVSEALWQAFSFDSNFILYCNWMSGPIFKYFFITYIWLKFHSFVLKLNPKIQSHLLQRQLKYKDWKCNKYFHHYAKISKHLTWISLTLHYNYKNRTHSQDRWLFHAHINYLMKINYASQKIMTVSIHSP